MPVAAAHKEAGRIKTKLRTAIFRPNLLFMRVNFKIIFTNKQEHLVTVILAIAGALVVAGVLGVWSIPLNPSSTTLMLHDH